jgi:hypothetical protein
MNLNQNRFHEVRFELGTSSRPEVALVINFLGDLFQLFPGRTEEIHEMLYS